MDEEPPITTFTGNSRQSSPPAGTEVPDPFLIDSDDEEEEEVSDSQQTATPSEEIPLALSSASLSVGPRTSFLTPNLNKDVPSPPSDSEIDEEDGPELYIPNLVLPAMFLPIPSVCLALSDSYINALDQTDQLTALLIKHIPSEKRPLRDITGNWQNQDFHTLVVSSWENTDVMCANYVRR